jgi:peptidoglycan/xylan/chitin deacetylase (PgdA/CDA1 family)
MGNFISDGLKGRLKQAAIAGGLDVALLLKSLGTMKGAAGLGAIFTLHHVRPYTPLSFQPNRHLEITPQFLDRTIRELKAEGRIFVALDELPRRIAEADAGGPRFAAFTLDDGNWNNIQYALPVFERHGVPLTIFVAKGLSERTHSMWWETLAALIGQKLALAFDFGEGRQQVDLSESDAKQVAFERFAAFVHKRDEMEAVSAIDWLAEDHGIQPLEIVRSLIMDTSELRTIAGHPLVSLGAHTVSHRALARLSAAEVAFEIRESAEYVASLTGAWPAAIAYPYGTAAAVSPRDGEIAARLGFSVGVTTRPGTVMPAAVDQMTMLPRISLNGYYQKTRYVEALASGIPMRMLGRAK